MVEVAIRKLECVIHAAPRMQNAPAHGCRLPSTATCDMIAEGALPGTTVVDAAT